MVQTVPVLLAFGTIVLQIVCILLIVFFIFKKWLPKKLVNSVYTLFQDFGLVAVFATSLLSMMGSLFFSQVLNFQPCVLCWYQRILLYPQALLAYIALMRKDKIAPYIISLSAIGAVIAIYHYYIQLVPNAITPCEVQGGVSCIKGYTFYFHYISIPLMSFTAFVFNILAMILSSQAHSKK